jgi:hypothetical protein
VQDENLLNRAIWYGSRGFDVPYPGDGRVLWPSEVTPAHEADEAEEQGVGDIDG